MQSHATASDSATRRHRPKTLTVFAAAFAAGAVLAYGVNRVVDVHIVQVEPQVESEPIFVALRSLPQGSPITVWDVALKDWPKALLPTAALKADASFEGMVLRHPVREGQPLLSVQLVRDGALLPGATIAAVPPAVPPAAAEQFRPAAPAEPQGTAAAVVAPPTSVETLAPAVTALPATEPAPVASASPAPATDMVALVPVLEQSTAQAVQSAEPAPATEALPAADVSVTQQIAAAVPPTSTDVDVPAAVPAPAVLPTVAEPTPAPFSMTATVAGNDARPLAAPIPALPSTDLERSLADVSRGQATPVEQPTSVLDRTTESETPPPTQTAPKHHLVVPERIALAVDASFTQPQPPSQAVPAAAAQASKAAAASRGTAPAAAAQARTGSRGKPGSSVPAARKPTSNSRQPAVRQQPSPARGLSAWLPQFSGSRSTQSSNGGNQRR